MEKEKSCGIVLYFKDKGNVKFLLLKYIEGHWDFVKGHREKNETDEETIRRETIEETGITEVKIDPKVLNKYFYKYSHNNEIRKKEVVLFLAETKTTRVKLSDEHTDYKWADYEQACKIVTFDEPRKALERAGKVLGLI